MNIVYLLICHFSHLLDKALKQSNKARWIILHILLKLYLCINLDNTSFSFCFSWYLYQGCFSVILSPVIKCIMFNYYFWLASLFHHKVYCYYINLCHTLTFFNPFGGHFLYRKCFFHTINNTWINLAWHMYVCTSTNQLFHFYGFSC